MTWFPTHERSTATAIMAAANYLGIAVSYVPSFIIPADGPLENMETALTLVNIVIAIITFIILIFVIVKFPSKPPTPPSFTSTHTKVGILKGLKSLVKNKKFWIIAVCCAWPLGICNMWFGVLGIILKQFKNIGIEQEHSGLIGILAVVAGCICAVSAGIIADKFDKKLKQIITVMYLCSAAGFLWFSLMYNNVITPNIPSIYISIIIGCLCMNATYPLFFEMCMKEAFPIGESSSAGFMIALLALVQSIFLLVPLKEGSTEWMNWTLIGSILTVVVVLFFFKENYKRLDIDLKNENEDKQDNNMERQGSFIN